MNPTTTSATSARRWGWAILLSTAAISLVFNIAHALEASAGAHLHAGLGVLYGVAPVLVALMLSHLIAIQRGGRAKRALTGLVFLAALGLSVSAIGSVLYPIAGPGAYVFAGMLDVAALMGLGEVLGAGHRTPAAEPGTAAGEVPEPQRPPVPDVPAAPVPEQPDPDDRGTCGEDTAPMPVLVTPPAPQVPERPEPAARRPLAAVPDTDLQERAELEFAAELAAGRTPTIREIKTRLQVGQANAQRVRAHLNRVRTQVPARRGA